MQTLFVRLFRFERLHHRNSILSWTICFTCSLKNRIQLICNDIECVRFFRKFITNAISKTIAILYKIALRHIFMQRFHLFSNRSNSKHLHQFTSRWNIRFAYHFREFFDFFFFRYVFFSRHFRVHFLFANIVKNVSSFIDLSIESCQMFSKLKTMKYSWNNVIEILFLFVLLWKSIDFSTSKKSLFRKNQHVVCLFVCSLVFLLIVDRFEKTKSCCCCYFNEFDISSFSFCFDLKKLYKLLYVLFYCLTNMIKIYLCCDFVLI